MLGESGDIGCYNHNEIIQLSLHTIPWTPQVRQTHCILSKSL